MRALKSSDRVAAELPGHRGIIMNRFLVSAGLLVLGMELAGAASSRPPIIPVEKSYELYTLAINLPRNVPARLTVRECDTCTPDVLRIENSSSFYIGKETVPYAQFAAHARARSYSLTVHYTPETKVVTRMIAAPN